MGQESYYTSSNTGGIKRGDSAETGDLQAQPDELFKKKQKKAEDESPEDLTILDEDGPGTWPHRARREAAIAAFPVSGAPPTLPCDPVRP